LYYLDSSIILNILLAQVHPLVWRMDSPCCFSQLLKVEARRTLRTGRQRAVMTEAQFTLALEKLRQIEAAAVVLPCSSTVMDVASGPFNAPIRTLDAIHLASAAILREQRYPDLVFATHDLRLGHAARAEGFAVVGVD
jgi:hypothetical protein